MKSTTGRQRRMVVMLSSLMICGALLAACQNGSGTEESQNPNGTGNTTGDGRHNGSFYGG